METATLDNSTQTIADLVRYLVTDGHVGDHPAWYDQYCLAQLLFCPPWELDEMFPAENAVPKSVWAERAIVVQQATRKAAEISMQRRDR